MQKGGFSTQFLVNCLQHSKEEGGLIPGVPEAPVNKVRVPEQWPASALLNGGMAAMSSMCDESPCLSEESL